MTLRVTPSQIVDEAEASGRPGLLAKAPGWSRIQVAEVARVVNGAPFDSSLFNRAQNGMPLVRIRDVGANSVSTWYDGRWDEVHRVRRGDLLIGMDGNFLIDRWRLEDAVLNQRVCRIDVDESKYNSGFLELVIQGYLDAIWARTSSTTVKHLSSKTVGAIPLPCPPLDEQRRIVEILEECLSSIHRATGLLAMAIHRADLLPTVITSHMTAEMSGVPLGDLILEEAYGTSTKCAADGAGLPVVRIPNIVNGRLDLTDEKRALDPSQDLTGLLLGRGDLLIVRTNGSRSLIGRTAVVERDMRASFASYLIRYRFDASLVRPDWVQLALALPAQRRQVEHLAASSAGQYNLSLGKLRGVAIPLPGLSEQDRVLEITAAIRDRVERQRRAVEQKFDASRALRRALLQAAFSGQLAGRASDLDRADALVSA